MASPGIAVPGSVVAIGSQASPAGPQGIQGPTAVSADSGNIATLGSDSLVLVPQSTIWSVRQRSFNAIGNPNFEVDQINVGNSLALAGGGGIYSIDQWWPYLSGTMRLSSQQMTGNILVPGTNFYITSKFLRFTVTTTQPSLGASDLFAFGTSVEGTSLRELLGDVHSFQMLVRSSVANLKFGLCLQSTAAPSYYVLGKLCSLGAANTWTLITLPNLPLWTPNVTWSTAAGAATYWPQICLAAGSGAFVPANDIWVATGNIGVIGQSNFVATLNATFDIAYVGHEPGAQCTALQDKTFIQNLDECQRFYSKQAPYANVAATGYTPRIGDAIWGSTAVYSNVVFPKRMAKAPTVRLFDNTAVVGKVYLVGAGSVAVASISATDTGIVAFNLSANAPSSGQTIVIGGWDANTNL